MKTKHLDAQIEVREFLDKEGDLSPAAKEALEEFKLIKGVVKERDVLLHALKNAVPTLKGLLSVASEHEHIDKQILFEIDSYTQLLKSIEKE